MTNNSKSFSIGVLSNKTGCKVPTIRYYEKEGLLAAPQRTEGNQRRYALTHLNRLAFIRHARELGFSLNDIRELILLSDDPENQHHAEDVAARNLQKVEHKILQLNALKQELSIMLKNCRSNKATSCRVIEVLSDHSLCSNEH